MNQVINNESENLVYCKMYPGCDKKAINKYKEYKQYIIIFVCI